MSGGSKSSKKADSAEPIILKYLTTTNRPYSINDIVNNLSGAVGKTAAQKALSSLVDQGTILTQTWGKQTIYWKKQSDQAPPTEEEEAEMSANIKSLQSELSQLKAKNKSLQSQLSRISSALPTCEISHRISEVKAQSMALEERVRLLTDGVDTVSKEEKESLERSLGRYGKEWRERKRKVAEMLEAIADGTDKKPKVICEELGLETDKMVGVVYESVMTFK